MIGKFQCIYWQPEEFIMNRFFILLLCLWVLPVTAFADIVTVAEGDGEDGKKIGLTLSGGGARGLAHVGVLHVIDSLDIQIDYISGTSMGAIVGGMYAAGYSAAEIETFALEMKWEALFARSADLTYIHPAWRDTEQRFIFELPIEDRKIRLSTGAIEGQQLWNTLNELFLHVHQITDFNELQIPFACVATNVENGEAIVMRDGNLVTAVRASMAIPSVFTVVERDGKKLIDGGVVNNFPVTTAKDMGADYVIGVNVSQGLRPADELTSMIDIIYQMGFYSDARSFAKNKEATDLFIEPELTGYNAASFFHTPAIIESGKQAARNAIPEMKELHYAEPEKQDQEAVPSVEEIELVIDSIVFEGLENVRPWFARNTMNINPGDTLKAAGLTRGINRLYATNYFNRVHYHLTSAEESGNVTLVLDVAEKPFASLSAAIHFNTFTGAGIIGRIATNKFFYYNIHASVTAAIGETPGIRTRFTFFLSDRRHNWLEWESQARNLTFPLYEDFEAISEYTQNHVRSELSFNTLTGENAYISSGASFYYQSLSPNMRGPVTIDGNISAWEGNLSWNYHTLNSNTFPGSGQRIQVEGKYIFSQRPSFSTIEMNGEETTPEEMGINIKNFFQARLNFESYISIRERLIQVSQLQFGYNFLYDQGFVNSFNAGGTYHFIENQVTFAGLNEYELITESILAGALGYRYNLGRNINVSLLTNAAIFDFKLDEPESISRDNFLFGAAASVGYDGLIGPMELTFSYSPETGNVIGYVNVGWAF